MAQSFEELLSVDEGNQGSPEAAGSAAETENTLSQNPEADIATDAEVTEEPKAPSETEATTETEVPSETEVTADTSEEAQVVEPEKPSVSDEEVTIEPVENEEKENKPVEDQKIVQQEPAVSATTVETTVAPEPTPEPDTAPEKVVSSTPETEKVPVKEAPASEDIIKKMAGIIEGLDKKLGNVSKKLVDLEEKFTLDIPEVTPTADEAPAGSGERKSVPVAPQAEPEKRPAITEPENEVTEPVSEPGNDNEPKVDPEAILQQFTSAYREVYPQLNADDRTSYTTALRHLNQGEGTVSDTNTITSILRRFS